MSAEISNDEFRADMIKQIKEIQETLNELKIIKTSAGKKSTERKTAKRKTVKRKTAKRKTSKRRQIPGKPNYLTNLCPNQYENS